MSAEMFPELKRRLKQKAALSRGKIGIYALFYNLDCVYVGQSDDIGNRISHHLRGSMTFDDIVVFDYTESVSGMSYKGLKSLLNFKEASYIHELRPLENKVRPPIRPEIIHDLPFEVQHCLFGGEIGSSADEESKVRSNPPSYLSVDIAAKYLGFSERTLRAFIAERKIPFSKIKRRVIFRRVDLDRWMESHQKEVVL